MRLCGTITIQKEMPPEFKEWCTPQQLEVITCDSPVRMVCTSRQAGKSTLAGVEILKTLLMGRPVAYFSETIKNSYDIIRPVIDDLCSKFSITGRWSGFKFITNGVPLDIYGLSNSGMLDRARGHYYGLCVIDEAFSENIPAHNLQYVMGEVLPSCFARYGGTPRLLLIGTPPPLPNSYGETLWRSGVHATFSWTLSDNPGIPNAEEFISGICKTLHLDRSHPKIQRECYGRFVYEKNAVLFSEFLTYEKDALPSITPTKCYIGIDYGYTDSNAIIGVAWDEVRAEGYVYYESKFNHSNSGDTVYKRLLHDLGVAFKLGSSMGKTEIYADCSDNIVTEQLRKKGFNIHLAWKQDAMAIYDYISAMLASGRLMIPQDGPLHREFKVTSRATDRCTGEVLNYIDDRKFHPDAIPALRYALVNAIIKEF